MSCSADCRGVECGCKAMVLGVIADGTCTLVAIVCEGRNE